MNVPVVARIAASLSLGLLASGCVAPGSQPVATPQRPKFSSNTNTTFPGSVEIEAGGEYDRYDRQEVPLTVKYGVTEGLEAFVGRSVFRHDRLDGPDSRGQSDTLVGTRFRIFEDADTNTSAALRAAVSVPNGSSTKGYSSEEYDWFLAAIYDGTFEGWAWTCFYQLGLLGEPAGGGRDRTNAIAFAASHNIGGDTSFFAEIAGIRDRVDKDYPIFATLGLTFAEQPTRVWDVAVRVPANEDAGDTVVKAGVTWNLSRASGAATTNVP
jgi:hypothetical protein